MANLECGEKWVIGYENNYSIDESGSVYSFKKAGKVKLKPGAEIGKYYSVSLSTDGKGKTHKIHRLVAIHFVENPLNLPCINHIDGDKSNNHYTNLEWCTFQRNIVHAFESGLNKSIQRGVACFGKEWDSISDCSKETGINVNTLNGYLTGHRTNKINIKYKDQINNGK